jgi:uncharacterized protein with FMN-binding domain
MQQIEPIDKRKMQAIIGLIAIVLILAVTAITVPSSNGMTSTSSNAPAPTPVAPTSQSIASTTPVASAASSSKYKDGSYNAKGSYFSPGGNEAINVSVTLANDVVTAANATSGANDPTAASYQTIFIGGYKKFVVGKNISSIKLTNVSGSSLTSQGFNDAIKQIEHQAKA